MNEKLELIDNLLEVAKKIEVFVDNEGYPDNKQKLNKIKMTCISLKGFDNYITVKAGALERRFEILLSPRGYLKYSGGIDELKVDLIDILSSIRSQLNYLKRSLD